MARKIYHILTEAEPFSSFHGGALSRWVAGTLREDEDAVVVCAESDGSWGFPAERVRILSALGAYGRWMKKATGFPVPWPIRKSLIRRVFIRGLHDLRAGDVAWVMNRPDFAAAITPFVAKRGARLVLHMHNSHLVECSQKVMRELAPDRIAFCSRFLESAALARHPHLPPTAVIPNGADDRLFFPAAMNTNSCMCVPEILFVGRLVPEKGAHVLVEAMRKLHERGVRAVAKIVGSAAFGNNQATGYVESLHNAAPENVEFLGYGDPEKLGEQFRSADIFCCPSIWDEPFGMINVEAMATRIPVVATRCGGIPEIFSEGGALLVGPDSAGELAEAIEILIRDPALRNRLANEGYTSFQKNFTWGAVHQRYREVIEALAA